ncbi:uncharacterized protein TEOVI_000073200 [Trypanosoma equiperdum]|uniref:Uncharacterized protein n=2 Tax=Trypanozoon TaxID=39700 RepID=Q584V7_TRYB2|nr:hypothetical protein, conserved [Trypanosoma brucei brucei TREU927]AAX80833.1 hypothetical protein, conserved [Trypanosoma brucei]AAZ11761.1 hypothetical protein, conserved [Trypanosoma brucei brucei TREU927]SCU69175.1 hypothetical protein, conserved [Trypanosoma equiperdum]
MLRDGDRYTFQFAELRGDSYYTAFGKITNSFLQMYRNTKHYELILTAFLNRLLEDPTKISSENYKILGDALMGCINTLVAERQAPEPIRRLKARGPDYRRWNENDEDEVFEEESEEEYDEGPQISEEEQKKLEEDRIERERLEEERIAAREEERRRNEEELRSRARQVDRRAMSELLQHVAVMNPGQKKPKGGKQQKQISAETVDDMEIQVTLLRKEKDRIQMVLQYSEEDLPSKLAEAKQQLDEVVSKLNAQGSAKKGDTGTANMGQKQLSSRLSELTQKQTKLTMERNRLALQLKTEPCPLREELLAVLKERDEAQVKVDFA